MDSTVSGQEFPNDSIVYFSYLKCVVVGYNSATNTYEVRPWGEAKEPVATIPAHALRYRSR